MDLELWEPYRRNPDGSTQYVIKYGRGSITYDELDRWGIHHTQSSTRMGPMAFMTKDRNEAERILKELEPLFKDGYPTVKK